jgi:hypothetical protein
MRTHPRTFYATVGLGLMVGLAALFQLIQPAALAAQPEIRYHIKSIQTAAAGRIDVTLLAERVGDFDIQETDRPVFRLRENGIIQQATVAPQLNNPNESPSRTVILADISRSVSHRQLANFKAAAIRFVKKLKPNDTVALITFHQRVRRELNFTNDHALLEKRITNLRRAGSRTMLYDALIEAHKMLADAPRRKAILVYTDGRENASRVRLDDVIELYTAHPVPLFVAGKHNSAMVRKLIRLARVSGGDAFKAQSHRDLSKVFYYLSHRRTHELVLSYNTSQKPGSTIDIEILPESGSGLVQSYTLPHTSDQKRTGTPDTHFSTEKLFSAGLLADLRIHMPEILLSLIVLLLVAVIIMLFFRRQEITVKVENTPNHAFLQAENIGLLPEKKIDTNKARLPLDYHHGWLVEKEGPHTGRKYKINWHSVTLGFADESSIVIDDNTVSPNHAKIARQDQKFVLFDLMSENGTFLNGKKLLRPKELNDFDEIGIGRTKLIFRKSATTYEKKNSVEARN